MHSGQECTAPKNAAVYVYSKVESLTRPAEGDDCQTGTPMPALWAAFSWWRQSDVGSEDIISSISCHAR